MADLEARVAVLESQINGLLTTVLTRLLDATVPSLPPAATGQVGEQQDDDFEEMPVVADWTDPFMGLDVARDYRAVGRLEAGELPPYLTAPVDAPPATNGAGTVGETDALERWRSVGEGSFDEWNRATHQPDVGEPRVDGWVAPIDLGEMGMVE